MSRQKKNRPLFGHYSGCILVTYWPFFNGHPIFESQVLMCFFVDEIGSSVYDQWLMDLEKLRLIVQAIYDKKGADILCFDVRGVSGISDFVVIASGNVDKHVKALAKEVEDRMRENGERLTYSEGYEDGRWVVLDFIGVIVHLLLPETRDFYHLESLWKGGKIVDLPIEVS